ncbi:MAG: PAS domain S-box protein [Balneolales bacterium]|nr:PAS domain S-box protein [Balneolales bacterium]
MTDTDPNYSSLFYLSPLPTWVYHLQTYAILDVNLAALNHYGYTKDEFLSLSLKDLCPNTDMPLLIGAHKDIDMKDGNIYFGVITHTKKSGDQIRMKINGHKVDFTGKKCMMVVGQDVTEEERKMKLLQESEQRLKAASEIAKLGYWRIELSNKSIWWSNGMYRIWERSEGSFNLSYESYLKCIHPHDLAIFEYQLQQILDGRTKFDVVHRIYLPDDRCRFVHLLGKVVEDENGRFKYLEGTAQDVTDRKREEQRLKLLESVATHINEAVLITEAEPLEEPGPRIIYVNDAFTKMTGYKAEEVIGKSPRFLQGPGSDRKELRKLSKALRDWESCEITTKNYKKNGEEFWINFTVSPVADENGWYTHWVAVERDVTETKNKEIEQELLIRISANFNEDVTLEASALQLCKTVREFGKFDFAELWVTTLDKSQLKLVAHDVSEDEVETFYALSKKNEVLNVSQGLPGKVWSSKKQKLWSNLDSHTDFVRTEAAQKTGISAALGIPLMFNNEVIGVLVIGTRKSPENLAEYFKIYSQLESFVGSEIHRKKLENDLNHMYQTVPDILCLTDFKGRFLKINKAGCTLLGYSKNEILLNSFDDFLHPAESGVFANEFSEKTTGNKTIAFENRFLAKNGKTLWLSWTCRASYGQGVIYATAKNITEEKKLREINEEAGSLAKVGSWEVDLEQDKVYWSELVYEIHEIESETYIPSMAEGINYYREDFIDELSLCLQDCMETGEPFSLEAVLLTAKQNERWVRVKGKAEIVDGKCKRIFGSMQDIHESKILELQIRDILGSISDAFYAVDNSWRFTYFNKEAERLLLEKENEVLGKIIWDVFPSTAGTLLQDVYTRVAETNTSESFEYLFPGDGKWYSVNAYPSNGGISSYFKNIDVEKLAEQKLKKAYKEKNITLESIGDAFFSVNKDWTVTYWNKQAEAFLGRKRENIVGKNLWVEYDDVIGTEFYLQYTRAMETGQNTTFEAYYDTVEKWFEVSVYTSKEGLSVYFKDVTLRKLSDVKLAEANERFQKVTEATNDAIWDWDIQNKLFFRSAGFEHFFGLEMSRQLTEDQFWKDRFHPEDLPLIKESLNEAVSNPERSRWEMEYRIINNNGEIVYVMDRGIVIRDSEGKAIRMVGAMSNITERKNHEIELLELNKSLNQYAKELERSNEELEQFAFITSHDLQEPLRMVSSFMDLLRRRYGNLLDEKGHEYIYFAMDGSKRMKNIILDLLEYSRAGRPTEDRELVDINRVIHEYKLLRRKIIEEKNVVITYKNLPELKTYRAAISQIFHCIVDNAIKYSREGQNPEVEILAEKKQDFWEFCIQDNGIGIDPKFFEKVFIIFQRLHNRELYSGTGVGLAVAKKQVEFLGGRIWVESKPNEGASFFFTIPVK